MSINSLTMSAPPSPQVLSSPPPPVHTPSPTVPKIPAPSPTPTAPTGKKGRGGSWEWAGIALSGLAAAAVLSLILVGFGQGFTPVSVALVLLPSIVVMVWVAASEESSGRRKISLVMGDLSWTRNSFCRGWLVSGVTGCGKCLGKGTPVMMFDGTIKPVEQIKAGDLLMGPDSLPRRVRSTNRGHGPLYRIIPRHGDPWVCNDAHVMTLRYSPRDGQRPSRAKHEGKTQHQWTSAFDPWLSRIREWRSRKVSYREIGKRIAGDPRWSGLVRCHKQAIIDYWRRRRDRVGPKIAQRPCAKQYQLKIGLTQIGGAKTLCNSAGPRTPMPEIVDVPLNEFLARTAPWQHEIDDGYAVSRCWKLFRVGVDFPQSAKAKALPDDYWYCLGLWLGDGSTSRMSITTADDAIEAWLTNFGRKHDRRISVYAYKERAPTREVAILDDRDHPLSLWRLREEFVRDGVKNIPQWALTGSREQRLLLLAGLLDSDGHLHKNIFEFATVIEHMAHQVAFLVRSLGYKATLAKKNTSWRKTDQTRGEGHAWRITLSGETEKIPTILERKRATLRQQRKNQLVTGWKAEAIGEGDYYGFTLDGDGRFLLGDFTVTHNTELLKVMLHLLCRYEKGVRNEAGGYNLGDEPWGGMAIDEKGFWMEEVLPILEHYGRGEMIVPLQTRPEGASPDWKPQRTINLLGDERVTTEQYVDAILRTAETIAKENNDKGFFKTQAGLHIGAAIDLVRSIRRCQLRAGMAPTECMAPTMKIVYEILTAQDDYNMLLERAKANGQPLLREYTEEQVTRGPTGDTTRQKVTKKKACFDGPWADAMLKRRVEHFAKRFWGVKAPEQLEGVKGTITNYLHWFSNDDVAEVFCDPNATFSIDCMDKGAIVCVSMPQKLSFPRRYVSALLKLFYYAHGRSRNPVARSYNLLILLQDEAQRFVQEVDGDVDILRQYQVTTIMSSQSKSSIETALGGKDKARPILLNLRNRVIMRASDEECAEESAKFIGKWLKKKTTKSTGGQKDSFSYVEESQFRYEPYQLRALPDFSGVYCHADKPHQVYAFAPMDADGCVPRWYSSLKITRRMRLMLPLIRAGWWSHFVPTTVPKPKAW